MSSQPFVATTTPTIETANRLISLRSHPGYLDMLRIAQELVQNAADVCADFPGWDPQQIVVLKVRMQTAKEFKDLLIAKINEAIRAGVDEARAQISSMPNKTVEDAVDQGDFVRQKVLENFEEQDNRSAGSY
jgi:exosome complex RNA-binding protein Csl4